MTSIRLQGYEEKEKGIYYEYDADCKPLGEGAMGRVFKGIMVNENNHMRTPIAVKEIAPHIPPHVIERARREAAIRINSENLLKMLGFVEITFADVSEGRAVHIKRHYVIMELLRGVTLYDLMQGKITDGVGNVVDYAKDLHNSFITDKYNTIKTIMEQVLKGVMALHNSNYIHRDIDPTNIMVCDDGHIKLIDFGICKKIDTLGSMDKNLTSTGQFMGKVNYASPELVLGDVEHQNRTTDIYSLGILLFQLCSGHLPFSGENNEVMLAHIRKPLPLKDIDMRSFRIIVEKATQKSQADRYEQAIDMLDDLQNASPSNRNKSKIFITLALAGIIGGISIAVLLNNDKPIKYSPEMEELLETQKYNLDSIKGDLWAKDEQTVYDAFQKLEKLAEKQDNVEAMFEYGLIYSVGNSDFPFVTERQKVLKIKPDIERANQWMRRTLEKSPDSYRAVYWLLNNTIAKNQKDENLDLANEIDDLLKLFDSLTNDSTDERMRKYKHSVDKQRNWQY